MTLPAWLLASAEDWSLSLFGEGLRSVPPCFWGPLSNFVQLTICTEWSGKCEGESCLSGTLSYERLCPPSRGCSHPHSVGTCSGLGCTWSICLKVNVRAAPLTLHPCVTMSWGNLCSVPFLPVSQQVFLKCLHAPDCVQGTGVVAMQPAQVWRGHQEFSLSLEMTALTGETQVQLLLRSQKRPRPKAEGQQGSPPPTS